MDFTFNYTLEKKDLINFELFKLKTSKFLNMVYITVLIVLVMNTYYAVSEKNYAYFLIVAFYIIGVAVYSFYVTKIRPKKRAERCLKKDITYGELREITVGENTVEFKTLPKEDEPMLIGVYPYNMVSAIIETKEYVYFIVPTGTNIFPISSIPLEIRAGVLKNIKKNPNYAYFDKI